jgi:hypothetical protein
MRLFPKAPLPPDFADSVKALDPDEFAGPSIEWKIELFKMLAMHAEKKQEIIGLWRLLFPSDEWINRLAGAVELPRSHP